jgi:hypothetical protein
MKGSYTDKVGLAPTGTASTGRGLVLIFNEIMNLLIKVLVRFGLLTRDLDYHLLRASMVIIYFFLGIRNGSHTRRTPWFPLSATAP